MNKNEWESAYRILSGCNSDFQAAYQLSLSGSNQKKRDEGRRRYESAMLLVITNIKMRPSLLKLLLGENSDHIQEAFDFDDFNRPHWFQRDLPRLLNKIEQKIAEFD